jgi:anti-sigma B factor antagonist
MDDRAPSLSVSTARRSIKGADMEMGQLTTCAVYHTDRSCRIVLAGEVDISNLDGVNARFEEALDAGGDLEVDLAGVTHMDSTMLGVLLRTAARMEERGRSFRVVEASPLARKLLRITGLTHLIDGRPRT